MRLSIHWRLDPAADPHRSERTIQPELPSFIRDRRTVSQNRFDYYLQVADAAAQTAFDGLFIRHRPESDESRIIAAVIARATPRLKIIPEFPASIGSAVYAAKQAATFQRSTHGRLGWAIISDTAAGDRARDADFIAPRQLTERLEEFLIVARGVHQQRPFTFKGEHFEVLNGGFDQPLNRVAFPQVFLTGDDDEALKISARQGDVHLFSPAKPDALAERIARLHALAAAEGRAVKAGLIQSLLVREDRETAKRDAGNLPVGTLVGNYDDAATQLADLVTLGLSHLVLDAAPALEESYRVGQHVLPRLHSILASAQAA